MSSIPSPPPLSLVGNPLSILRRPFTSYPAFLLLLFSGGTAWWFGSLIQRENRLTATRGPVYLQWWVTPVVLLVGIGLYILVRKIRSKCKSRRKKQQRTETTKPSAPEPKPVKRKSLSKPVWHKTSEQESEYRRRHAHTWKQILTPNPAVEAQTPSDAPPAPIECGVGFSGGGIRAAAYASGAAKGLLQTNVWPRIQYMSSVSGGGYITSAIALAHDSFRKNTQDFFYERSLHAGYCFRQDGTIRELVSTFLHFACRVFLAMVTNSVVMILNLLWMTRLIDSALGPFLMLPEIQSPVVCQAILCVERIRMANHEGLNVLWVGWVILSILGVVMWKMAAAITGNFAATERVHGEVKRRSIFQRAFPPAFALVRFLWLALSMLFFVLAIAVIHRGGSVGLYSSIESGLVIIIAIVALMTLIFSNLSHTAGYDALPMFVLPLAGLALVLVFVFVCGLIVAARVHSHLVEAANTDATLSSAPAHLIHQVTHALQNATQTMHDRQAAATSAGLGQIGTLSSISSWVGSFSSFFWALWNEKPWSAATWRQLDWIASGCTFALTLLYDRIHDVLTSVYRDGLANSFHRPREPHRRTFSSLVEPEKNDQYATPIWLCNAVLNDVSYAAGLMGQMAFSYCPFLFSPFGMGCQASGFALFRQHIEEVRHAPEWADPTAEFGMSVSAAAMTPAMGPMQKMIPGARLIFNLAGANMGDLLPVRKPSTTVLWFIWLFAGMIFLADALPYTGENTLVREMLPEVVLATSDHMRGWAWLLASFALLSIPLYKIAGLPGSEDIFHSKYIRMLFQSFGYVCEIEPSGYAAASTSKQPSNNNGRIVGGGDVAAHFSVMPPDTPFLRARLLSTENASAAAQLNADGWIVGAGGPPLVDDFPSALSPMIQRAKSVAAWDSPPARTSSKKKRQPSDSSPSPGWTGGMQRAASARILHVQTDNDVDQQPSRSSQPPPSGSDVSRTPKIPASYGSPDFLQQQALKVGSVFPRLHAPNVGISDGGHFENLGVFQLLLRRVPKILAFDAGEADLSFGRTWARYDDLVTLFSSSLRDWMHEHGVRIELTSIMAYSVWDRSRVPEPLFHSTDFQEALHTIESDQFNQPLDGGGLTLSNAISETALRKQARCLVIRFKYLPLRHEDGTAAEGMPGLLIYSKLQCLGLDAQLMDLPDGPSILSPIGWPLAPTSNQFISQMTYLKWALLSEQAAREAAVLLYYATHQDEAYRLPDKMPSEKKQRRREASPACDEPLPAGLTVNMWPMRCHYPLLPSDSDVFSKDRDDQRGKYYDQLVETSLALQALQQPIISPKLVLVYLFIAVPSMLVFICGLWYPLAWLTMLLLWTAYAFFMTILLHAKAISYEAHEYYKAYVHQLQSIRKCKRMKF